jgi:hypothetical protein
MTHVHAFQINKLENDFSNIITLKREIAKVKKVVADKLSQLKEVYNELIKTNNKKIFLFCLDSFYFQYKTFAMEMEHIDKYRALMNNRMYCDYYKLYNIIVNHVKENKGDIDIGQIEFKSYPAYKDLEPFQEYKIDDIKDLHANILHIITELYKQTYSKEDSISHYNENHKVGFSISNFLNTLEYENRLLREQISLYMNYVSFFHISQKKQLNRLHARMQDFYKEVDDNINVNKTFSIEDILEEEKLNKFFIIGEDVVIENILEDTEFLMEGTEKIINKIENRSQPDEEIDAEQVVVDEDSNITIIAETDA